MEERDLRGERDVPLGNGIVKIAQRKIPPILEREHLSAFQEVLSKCDQDIYLKFCANEWPLKNGQPVLPDWSDETTIERAWTDFTHEERVKELAFFKECLKLMEDKKLFYAADPETHNRLVGAARYEETLAGIRNALDQGLSVRSSD